jgi:hypothetical protein
MFSRHLLKYLIAAALAFAPSLARADSTVSSMTAAGVLTGTELFYCVQGGADRNCTANQIKTFTGSGGTPAGASLTLQYNNASAFGGMSGTSWDDTNRSLTMTGSTITVSHPVLDMTQTWNNAATTFTGLRLNVTNTLSAANSALIDLQLGGSSKFKVANNSGIAFISLGTGNASATEIDILGSNATAGSRSIIFQDEGTSPAINIGYNGLVTWSGGDASPPDLILTRDAANILAQRNGVTANSFRVYNTFTDLSNYERGVQDWTTTANTLTIGAQAAGTGTLRPVAYVGVHHKFAGTAPTPSACGTTPALTGSDTHGTVTMGTGTPTGCVITFAVAYVSAPDCVVTWQTNLASMTYTISTTAITLTQTATSSNKVNYVCHGT